MHRSGEKLPLLMQVSLIGEKSLIHKRHCWIISVFRELMVSEAHIQTEILKFLSVTCEYLAGSFEQCLCCISSVRTCSSRSKTFSFFKTLQSNCNQTQLLPGSFCALSFCRSFADHSCACCYGPAAVVLLLWSYCCGPATVVLLDSYCCY